MQDSRDTKTAFNIIRQVQMDKNDPAIDEEDWEWISSEEIKTMLSNMGLYGTMREIIHVIASSKNKREIDLAKSKMDGLSKVMSILKNATTVAYSTGGGILDDKITNIEITLKRPEDDR